MNLEDSLKNSLLLVCRSLQKFKIDYLVVGGAAVALNGYYRHSVDINGEIIEKPDIDIWFNPTYDNYFNLLHVLGDLGLDIKELKAEKIPNPRKSFFRISFDEFTVDFLPKIKSNSKFLEVLDRAEMIQWLDTKIYYMCYSDLIEDKLASGRKKDIEDIKQLKKLSNHG